MHLADLQLTPPMLGSAMWAAGNLEHALRQQQAWRAAGPGSWLEVADFGGFNNADATVGEATAVAGNEAAVSGLTLAPAVVGQPDGPSTAKGQPPGCNWLRARGFVGALTWYERHANLVLLCMPRLSFKVRCVIAGGHGAQVLLWGSKIV
jgi:hypothetical protein